LVVLLLVFNIKIHNISIAQRPILAQVSDIVSAEAEKEWYIIILILVLY